MVFHRSRSEYLLTRKPSYSHPCTSQQNRGSRAVLFVLAGPPLAGQNPEVTLLMQRQITCHFSSKRRIVLCPITDQQPAKTPSACQTWRDEILYNHFSSLTGLTHDCTVQSTSDDPLPTWEAQQNFFSINFIPNRMFSVRANTKHQDQSLVRLNEQANLGLLMKLHTLLPWGRTHVD
jgi:hypothetical protein